MPQHLESVFVDVRRRQDLLKKLLEKTNASHKDYPKLSLATKSYGDLVGRVDGELERQSNYAKLLSISSSVMKTGIMGDAFLDSLASNKDRQFLKEGDLIKVCRKSNKTFRFWLFSDYVMYGAKYVGTDKFEFHRSIKLDETVVKQGGEGENSLMVSSKEKSFVLLCYTKYELEEWFEALSDAIKRAR